mmetsp:Transcript_6299/g.11227  ORF Transcript_6299/g.11227 Transcript_6299/m.11227 type:complete len:388 (-) Transcript_6299:86-1249(-)
MGRRSGAVRIRSRGVGEDDLNRNAGEVRSNSSLFLPFDVNNRNKRYSVFLSVVLLLIISLAFSRLILRSHIQVRYVETMDGISENRHQSPQKLHNGAFSEHQRPVSRIALIFLALDNFPWEPLWREWLYGHDDKYILRIHSDKSHPNQTSTWFNEHRTREIQETKWATPNITRAYNLVVKEILEADPLAERFVFLCPHSVPIQPFDHVYDALMESECGWFEPMSTDRFAMNLTRKTQNWRAFSRAFAEQLVYGKWWEKYSLEVENGSLPWRILGDEYYATAVAYDSGMWDACWTRSMMWTFWNKALGRPRPDTFTQLNEGDIQLASLRKAKQYGVLFARKFMPSSKIQSFCLHNTSIRQSHRALPLHPLILDHRQPATPDRIVEIEP